MKASVIVPTFKRFHQFVRCINSLLNQSLDPNAYEIIAVHDGFDHNYNLKWIAGIMAKYKNFCFYTKTWEGVSAARNYAIDKSQGDYILMIDDDCEAHFEWIETMVKFLENNPDISAAGGQVLAIAPITSVQRYVKFKNLLRRPVKDRYGQVVTIITANAIYRRSVIESIGTFSMIFTKNGIPCGGEDLDLAFRASRVGKLGYCDKAIVKHDHRSTLLSLIIQHFNYGRGVFLACVENKINYHRLKFRRPTIWNLFVHMIVSVIRIYTISIPEYKEKCLSWHFYIEYFCLDLLRRNLFMFGAVYEFYKNRGDNYESW